MNIPFVKVEKTTKQIHRKSSLYLLNQTLRKAGFNCVLWLKKQQSRFIGKAVFICLIRL